MEGYLAIITNREAEGIASTLTNGFDGKPIAAIQKHPWSDELARAKVKEWVVGDELTFVRRTGTSARTDTSTALTRATTSFGSSTARPARSTPTSCLRD